MTLSRDQVPPPIDGPPRTQFGKVEHDSARERFRAACFYSAFAAALFVFVALLPLYTPTGIKIPFLSYVSLKGVDYIQFLITDVRVWIAWALFTAWFGFIGFLFGMKPIERLIELFPS